jgi:hypothetical protein
VAQWADEPVNEFMTTSNAFAFIATGLVMYLAPGVWPNFFPASGPDGSCASALWLYVMAPLHGGVGTWQVVHNEIRPLWQLFIAWEPASVASALENEFQA